MIESYKIKKVNNEEVLYIYLNYDYEFGLFKETGKSILQEVKRTIDTLEFNGKKIVLMAGIVMLASLVYTGTSFKGYVVPSTDSSYGNIEAVDDLKIENKDVDSITKTDDINEKDKIPEISKQENNSVKSDSAELNIQNKKTNDSQKTEIIQGQTSGNSTNNNTSQSPQGSNVVQSAPPVQNTPAPTQAPSQPTPPPVQEQVAPKQMVTVYRSNGSVLQIELEEYIVGVVAAEMPASFNVEALKAQAILARTYTFKRISRSLTLTDTVSTQEYIDINQMKAKWQGDFQRYYDKIKLAVDSTKGKNITYNGDYIDAVYHSTSNGYTEDSVFVWGNSIPYLKSVDSSWDKSASSYLRTETKDNGSILRILGISISDTTPIEVLTRSTSGRITSIKIGDSVYKGTDIRNLLGLRSTDFDVIVQDGNLVFTTRGYGHGVGMSQYGANGMANSGYTYEQVIHHYYQGVQING
jgi:stage II sporulation protein D